MRINKQFGDIISKHGSRYMLVASGVNSNRLRMPTWRKISPQDSREQPTSSLRFGRKYNVFPDLGTQNMAVCDQLNCADEGPCVTQSILTTESPIVRFEDAQHYDVYFVISSLPAIVPPLERRQRLGKVNPPPVMKSPDRHCNIESISSYPPLFNSGDHTNVTLIFDLNPLDWLPSTRQLNQQVSYTNSRAVATVNAEPPVKSETVGLETTVSFDITLLSTLP